MNVEQELLEWVEYARKLELELALKRIKKGEDPNLVMNEFSHKLTKKLLHPIIMLTKSQTSTYDSKRSQREYKENYLDSIGPKSDHVTD